MPRFQGAKGERLNQIAVDEWHWVYYMKSDLAPPEGEEGGAETREQRELREQQADLRLLIENLIKTACWSISGKMDDEGHRNKCVVDSALQLF